jgi:hypothetical protein
MHCQCKVISIRKNIHISLLLLALCCMMQPVWAQVKFYTLVSETTIPHRQTFQVQYIVEGAASIGQFNLPKFRGFEVQSVFDHSTSTNLRNGIDSYSKIIVLLATKKGRFLIPGASAVINGKAMHSNPMQVVVKQGVPGLNNINPDDIDTEQESVLHPGENINDKIEKNFFLQVEPSKTTCYVGEPLMVVYKAYLRLNANSQVVKRPSLTGFSVMEMVDAYDGKPEIERLNGRLYYTNLIRKVQLFPLQEGNYTLDPAEIETVIHFTKTDESADKRNALGKLFNRNPTPYFPVAINHRTILRTKPQTITVKPLPIANQPADFSGAVGQFSLIVKVPPTPIHEGDLVKIQVSVTGSGNISLLTPPVIKWPKGVDTAEPSVKENINKYVFPLSGTKTFEYTFAAPDTGDYIIPAVHFPYYDPSEKKYKTAASDSILLHVLPGVKNKDVVNDKTVNGRAPIRPQFYWFALIAVVIIACIAYQVISLGKGKKTAVAKPAVKEVEIALWQKTAAEILATARLALQHNHRPRFYNEVQKALWNVVADKYKVLPSEMNKYHLAELLAQKQIPAATIQNISSVLDECEWALYTPTTDTNDMTALLAKAEGALTDLRKY